MILQICQKITNFFILPKKKSDDYRKTAGLHNIGIKK